jgi:hypothetical protein
VWEWQKCCWKCPINLVRNNNLDKKIVAKATKSGTRVVGLWPTSTQIKNTNENKFLLIIYIFFKWLRNLQMSLIFVIIGKAFNFNLGYHVGRHKHEHSNISHQSMVNNCPSFQTSLSFQFFLNLFLDLVSIVKLGLGFNFNSKIGFNLKPSFECGSKNEFQFQFKFHWLELMVLTN